MIVSPLSVTLHRRKSAGRKINLNLNWYRNVHFQINNQAKLEYKTMMMPQLSRIARLTWPVKIRYRYYVRQKCDVGNIHAVVEKFFLDVLVAMGKLPDDNIHYVVGASYVVAGVDRKNPRAEIEILENYQP